MIKGFGILKNDAMPFDYLVYKTLVLALAQCSGTAAPLGREQSETSEKKVNKVVKICENLDFQKSRLNL